MTQKNDLIGQQWKCAIFLILLVTPITTGSFMVAKKRSISLGPRPYYLVDQMEDSALKKELQACADMTFSRTDFCIGHRGAPLQFPEHTKESYEAAARMGAGILECDVTFTKDKQLVCRHSQCDLQTTTNILAIPGLAARCAEPFQPAKFDPKTGKLLKAATAKCCTSDITLAEFKTLRGKMDGANKRAKTVGSYLKGTARWRTDLYASTGTVMTHVESIALFKKLGVKMTPELKTPCVPMPYNGYTQQDFAQQLIDDYKMAGVPASDVFVQSANLADIFYWLKHEPDFGQQAIYLDDNVYRDSPKKRLDKAAYAKQIAALPHLAAKGLRYIAPPIWVLLELDANDKIVPSDYAKAAKAAGLNIITWSLERSGSLRQGGGWYYQTISDVIEREGDVMTVLDVLAQQVGIKAIFSDWPATVTYYANCKGI
ncbi:MAG TPA: glycerophosphodiester phosphodiesterase [Thiothrix sp.]|nr:glycerophosphodiester phosphodiesterase [Thiothrix sp.]